MQDQNQQQALDPTVVNLAKAIRQTESGGDFSATGKSGEHGAYQFTPDTWNAVAPKYGINVPIDKATPEQQNAVAYNRIKQWKDQGNDVTQIASMWNAGEGEPNAYTGKFGSDTGSHKAGDPSVGVNKFGAKYSVPDYAASVSKAYLSLKNGGQPGADPNNPSSTASTANAEPQEETLGSKLSTRAGNAAQALSDTATGKINPLSGILQTVGQAAGGVNDVVGKGLEMIPGVKSIEGLISKGVGKLANTGVGQSAISGVQKFTQAHPELSGDIGAAGNILGTAGLLTGAGELKDLAGNAIAKGLGKEVLSGTVEDIAPNLGGKALASDIAKKGTTKSLISGEIKTAIDPALKETANVIDQAIPKFGKLSTFSEKVNAVKGAIGNFANELKTNLAKSEIQPILTGDDITTLQKGIATQIEQNPMLVGDAGKQAQQIFEQFKRFLPQEGDITMDKVLDARQKLDQWITKIKGPNAFDPKMENAISTGLRAVRQGANDLMEAKAPEAGVKALLRKQTLLYDAVDNMAPKAAKEVGTTGFGRFAGRHPVMTGLLKNSAKAVGTGIGAGGIYSAYEGLKGQ